MNYECVAKGEGTHKSMGMLRMCTRTCTENNIVRCGEVHARGEVYSAVAKGIIYVYMKVFYTLIC